MSATKENCPKTVPSHAIPIRHVLLDGDNDLPNDYSTTPGGTMFSTTPGGTRIIYQRPFLMKCRKSPLARTPPTNLPEIPGVTAPGQLKFSEGDHEAETGMHALKENGTEKLDTVPETEKGAGDEQFDMDI